MKTNEKKEKRLAGTNLVERVNSNGEVHLHHIIPSLSEMVESKDVTNTVGEKTVTRELKV